MIAEAETCNKMGDVLTVKAQINSAVEVAPPTNPREWFRERFPTV